MSEKKLRVVHVLSGRSFSGAENTACQIIKMFGDDADMLYISPKGPFTNILKSKGIKFIPLKTGCIAEIKRIIRQVKPDIIHAHDLEASLKSAAAARGIPVIAHIHSNIKKSPVSLLKNFLFRLYLSRYSSIISASNSVFKDYRFKNAVSLKNCVLNSVIDASEFYKKADADKNDYKIDIMFSGGADSIKNPQRFIRIAKKVVEAKNDVKIYVVGDGHRERRLKLLSKRHNLTDNIIFTGYIENPMKMLQSSRVLVITSKSEGMPLSALGAMAFGVPIVATRFNGVYETVTNGITGFISDDDRELTNYILEILSDDGLYSSLSRNSKGISMNRNNISAYRDTIESIYKNALLKEDK